MNSMVFNRTSSDVARVETLRKRIKNQTATPAETLEWLSSLKGAYNYTDLNRVGEAISYLSEILNKYGYRNIVTPKTDWQLGEKPNAEQLTKYIDDLKKIRAVFPILNTTPQVPADMVSLTYEEANDIEKILYDIDVSIRNMENISVVCGVANFGQEKIWQTRFRRPHTWEGLRYSLDKYNQAWLTITSPSNEVGMIPTDSREHITSSINCWNSYLRDIDKLAGVIN